MAIYRNGASNMGLVYISNQFQQELTRNIREMKQMATAVMYRQGQLKKEYTAIVKKSKAPAAIIPQGVRLSEIPKSMWSPMKKGIGQKYLMYAASQHLYNVPRGGVLTAGRQRTLQNIAEDYHDLSQLIVVTLEGYLELAMARESLVTIPYGQVMAQHLLESLQLQVSPLNQLFGTVNAYSFLLQDTLTEEEKAIAVLSSTGQDDLEIQDTIMRFYQLLMEKRGILNKMLAERNESMRALLETMRQDMAKIKVAEMESDVQERNQKLEAYKQKSMVEDIHDYEDLEGQYRNQFDEKGELIETSEEIEEEQNTFVRLLGAVVVVAVLVFLAYKFLL